MAGIIGPVSGEVEIGEVRPEECEAAGEVVVAAYSTLPGGHLSPEYAAELADVRRRRSGATVLVARDGDAVVGCVTLVTDASSPWAELVEPGESAIRMLAVAPGSQGRGVGRLLVEACLERAAANGSGAVVLHSTPWMTVAHHLYERTGFARLPERDFLPVPDVPLMAFHLSLSA